ncbi:MAG TPA: GNAT family N-acetyltransferase [Anaerolineales bacterium]|nr:GNAT family N-acetyltransferase [Anaerolineales bacterium]
MTLAVRRLRESLRQDFFSLHSDANGCGLCQCVAWWVPTWDGWADRSPAENRALRESLFDQGEYDGYLLYRDETPIGWAQVGRRDRLERLVREYALPADPSTWAITCFLLAPSARGQGLAQRLLREVLADAPRQGASALEAFPRRGEGLSPEEVWTGTEGLFRRSGFSLVQDHPRRPRYRRELVPMGRV